MKKYIVALIVIVLIGLGLWYSDSNNQVTETGPIKIGVIAPLTGEAAEYGESVRSGVSIAIDEINQRGGINGRQVEVIYEDGKCNGKDAASAAQKLVNIDQVKVVIGGTCSGETFGAAPITTPAEVILFSTVSSAAKVADLGKFVFRNHPNDNLAGEQLAEYVAKRYKKAAVVSEQTDYAQGLAQKFIEEAESKGVSVVFNESYTSDTKDFRSIVSKLKATGAEVVFLSVQTSSNASQLAKQIRDLGMVSPQLLTAYLTGPDFVKSGPAVEGTIIIDVPGLGSGPKAEQLIAAYRTKYNSEPNYRFFVGTSYDATHILADAITKNGLDTIKIANYLHSLKNYTGSIGTYSLDPEKPEVIGLGLVFRQVKGGELIEVSQ